VEGAPKVDAGGKLIPDLDIYRTGNILAKQHGEDTPIQAVMMPSLDIIELANQSKTGKYNFALANQKGEGVWVPRPKWKPFENTFALLTDEAPA
jgi:hypothetical protein